jgi:hypothetical protein
MASLRDFFEGRNTKKGSFGFPFVERNFNGYSAERYGAAW